MVTDFWSTLEDLGSWVLMSVKNEGGGASIRTTDLPGVKTSLHKAKLSLPLPESPPDRQWVFSLQLTQSRKPLIHRTRG